MVLFRGPTGAARSSGAGAVVVLVGRGAAQHVIAEDIAQSRAAVARLALLVRVEELSSGSSSAALIDRPIFFSTESILMILTRAS